MAEGRKKTLRGRGVSSHQSARPSDPLLSSALAFSISHSSILNPSR